jgi:hypothetical protein
MFKFFFQWIIFDILGYLGYRKKLKAMFSGFKKFPRRDALGKTRPE